MATRPAGADATRGLEALDVSLYSNGQFDFLMVEAAPDREVSEVTSELQRGGNHGAGNRVLTQWTAESLTPLKRIFKKEPLEDFLVRKSDGVEHTVATLEIEHDPELLQAYIDAHRPENMWPQVLANMDTMGIQDMELYLIGYQAFLVMTVSADFDPEKAGRHWGALPREKEWQQYVAKFQRVDPQSSATEKWKPLPLVV